MGKRAIAALSELAAHHDGERVVAVTHGGPIRAALARAAGITHTEARRRGPVLGNCFVARFSVGNGHFERLP
jgi:broad specificity phosphatase PhoE